MAACCVGSMRGECRCTPGGSAEGVCGGSSDQYLVTCAWVRLGTGWHRARKAGGWRACNAAGVDRRAA